MTIGRLYLRWWGLDCWEWFRFQRYRRARFYAWTLVLGPISFVWKRKPVSRDEGDLVWNYRAIKEVCEGETVCRVYEVYYNKKKEITGWTADAIHAQGETLEELRAELIMMLHDVSQLPMLDMEELRKQFPGDEGER